MRLLKDPYYQFVMFTYESCMLGKAIAADDLGITESWFGSNTFKSNGIMQWQTIIYVLG